MRLPVFPASVRALHSPGDGHWAFVLCGGMPVCLCACVRAYGRACAFFASPARPRVRLLHRAVHVQRHMCRRETLLCRGLSCPSAIRRLASRAMPMPTFRFSFACYMTRSPYPFHSPPHFPHACRTADHHDALRLASLSFGVHHHHCHRCFPGFQFPRCPRSFISISTATCIAVSCCGLLVCPIVLTDGWLL